MIIRRAYKFRVYPTPEQTARMGAWRRSLRWLWNIAREQWQINVENRTHDDREYPNFFQQNRELTELRALDPRLADVPSCCCQETLRDLEKAWRRCFQRVARAPRFKRARQADGMRLYAPDQNGWRLVGRTLTFRKLGDMRLVLDRPLEGKPSSCSLVCDVDQHFAIILCEVEVADPAPRGLPAVAINRGAVHGVVDSTGRIEEAPRPYERQLIRIARLARRLTSKERGSKNAEKARLKLARAHRKIRRRREHWQHQESLRLVENFDLVGIESYDTKGMTESRPRERRERREVTRAFARTNAAKAELNRAILDVGWYEIARQVKYKAESRGARVVDYDHFHISMICSRCGQGHVKPATGKTVFECEACGHRELGDVNASRNGLVRTLEAPEPRKRERRSVKIPGRRKASENGGQAGRQRPAEDSGK